MSGRPWTTREEQELRDWYPKIGPAALPHRSPGSVQKRAARLNLSSRRTWTKKEDALLMEGRFVPGRSKDAMRNRLFRMKRSEV